MKWRTRTVPCRQTDVAEQARALQVRGEALDWTQPYRGPKYDIVLACDVLYEVQYY